MVIQMVSVPVLMAGAVTFYVGWQFLRLFYKFKQEPEQLAFAWICFSFFLYDLFSFRLYNSMDIAESMTWQRCQFSALALVCIGFMAFAHFFIGKRYWVTSLALALVFSGFLIGDIAVTDSCFFNLGQVITRQISYTPLFHLEFVEIGLGWLPSVQYAFMIIGGLFVLCLIVKHYYADNKKAGAVIISLAVFFLVTVNDLFVAMGIIHSIYLIEYAFLLVVFSMSNMLLKNMAHIRQENILLHNQMETEIETKAEKLTQKFKQSMEIGLFKDPITGLPNRKSFFKHFQANDWPQAILIIDIDRIKNINCAYGRNIGDELIRRVAKKIQTVLSNQDYLARLDGAELAILSNCPTKQLAIDLADKLIQEMDTTVVVYGINLHISASIGVAFYPEDGRSISILLTNANVAMSYVSPSGNGYRIFKRSMHDEIHRHNKILNDLRYALDDDKGQIEVHYQPIVDQNKALIGAEALFRWKHPDLGHISPVELIPLAENAGLIGQITRTMLTKVSGNIAEWGSVLPWVSINISTLDLMDTNFLQNTIDILSQYGLAASRLRFEITESHMMKEPEKAFGILNELSSNGIRLLIDDFGTGHSSLSYLPRFPKGTTVKIDQSFTRDMSSNQKNIEIIKLILDMVASLKMDAVVEGVEDGALFETLKDLGLTKMQGFYFSKPLCPDKFQSLYLH